jgi:Na+-translocating ferredoxin:NAD+ oxidoreductase RnfC subunit
MSLVDKVKAAGVVGAGGGGFPTHVKLAARADTVVANGAECEPLLHKDAAVMEHRAGEMIEGMIRAMEAVGAKSGIVGIKAKNAQAVDAVQAATAGTPISVHLLGDYYPAGDEYDLVYETTGRLTPPAGIPLNVGVVVCNVETLVNVARAAKGQPVTEKTLTVAGAVKEPVTLTVPVGTPFRDVIEAAGGLTSDEPLLCVGGLMMGQNTEDLAAPVTKTTTGIVVLPKGHRVAERKSKPSDQQARIGKSACDQCRFCTEFCPRYLLGYPVEPHRVMRSLAFTATDRKFWDEYAALCSACGLCTLYSCPEELYPKEACDDSKEVLRQGGFTWTDHASRRGYEVKPHPMRDGRRIPIRALMRRLRIEQYDHPAHWEDRTVTPNEVRIPLKQGAGVPNEPLVKPGDRVERGQQIGTIPDGKLGAVIHASIAGTVSQVGLHVVIARS